MRKINFRKAFPNNRAYLLRALPLAKLPSASSDHVKHQATTSKGRVKLARIWGLKSSVGLKPDA
ncbi:MAG TPA: hypothetical protein DCP08_07030, partial [Chloroflexi bacterium]|nr:hypothetical protein [Chloroflexota bacterium]